MYRVLLTALNSALGQMLLTGDTLPDGLDSMEIKLARHSEYHGVFPEVSSKLKFLCKDGGRDFIWAVYMEKGIDAQLNCKIYFSQCSGEETLLYDGIIDMKSVSFDSNGANVTLRPTNCVDLFLSRVENKINLFDKPCFKHLTYDKTAFRRRYLYAPYLVEYPEKEILGWAQGVLNTSACNYGTATSPRIVTSSDFVVGLGSTGKTIFVCDGLAVPCGYNPACDNYNVHPTSANNNWSPSPGAQIQDAKIRNYPVVKWKNNDLDFANEFNQCDVEGFKQDYAGFIGTPPPPPQIMPFGQGFTGWAQEFRREEYNITPPSVQADIIDCGAYVRQFRDRYNDSDEAGVEDGYMLSPRERLIQIKCDCQELRIRCRAKGKQRVFFFASKGANTVSFPNPIVEYIRTSTRANLFLITGQQLATPSNPWQDISTSLGVSGTLTSGTWTGLTPCTPLTLGFEHWYQNTNAGCGTYNGYAYFTVGSENTWVDFDTGYLEFNFTGCDLKRGDCIFFALETLISGIVDNGPIIIRSVVEWTEIEIDVLYQLCDRVGTTKAWSVATHEAFARLVEHYTNNCLSVRSAYYGRSNSLAGADSVSFQTEPNCTPPTPDCPNPMDVVWSTEKLRSYQTGSHTNAVCPSDGCGAFKVLTSGNCLREWSTGIFTSFKELFDSMNAIDNIGAGYLASEPDAIRVENYEYFYQDGVILSLEIDYNKSKFTRSILTSNYYNKLICGYSEDYVKDYVNSIDEFNTPREYNIKVKNADASIIRRCNYIASGYTFEYMRRHKYSASTNFDEKIFVACVYPSTDTSITNNMWRIEQGITNPSYCGTDAIPFPRQPHGIISPQTVYNWRIRPQYNACRNYSAILPSIHFSQDKSLQFAYGEVNYTIRGSEPGNNIGCDIGYDYVSSNPFATCESDEINNFWLNNPRAIKQRIINEEVSFNYALTSGEFELLRNYPYKQIVVNGERFYLKTINYKPGKESKITLIKAY
jgi:hypothetical protein